MRRVLALVFGILIATFLSISVFSLAMYRHQAAGMEPVEGTIIDWVGDKPLVRYTVDGGEYTFAGTITSSMWKVGTPYQLLVDMENPSHAADRFFLFFGLIWAGATGMLVIVAAVMLLVTHRRVRRREELLRFGTKTTATVMALTPNRTVRVNGCHPWNIEAVCVHPLTGVKTILRSHLVWKPSVRPGATIEVAFDPDDGRKYVLNIPEEAP